MRSVLHLRGVPVFTGRARVDQPPKEPTMPRIPLLRLALLALLSLPAAGCRSSTDPPTSVIPDLVGTWSAVVPDEPFPVTTLSGLYQVRMRWTWTFNADGTYERRESLVTDAERSDTYVATGTWTADGDEIRFVHLGFASAAATRNPWPVRLVAAPARRHVDWMGYMIAGGRLHLFPECNDTASCAGIPALSREP